MLFKAIVKSRESKEYTVIESDYPTKGQFIEDLRGNGYMVNPLKVKEAELYNWIMENTNCDYSDWKYINRIPNENENVSDWIFEGQQKDHEKDLKKTEKLLQKCDDSHKQFLQDIGMNEEQFQEWLKNNKK